MAGSVLVTATQKACDAYAESGFFIMKKRARATEIVVGDIMVTDVATVDEHASLRQAALFLERHRIGCLPVMSGDELKGIITDTDFVAVAINLLEQIEESEPFDEELDEVV